MALSKDIYILCWIGIMFCCSGVFGNNALGIEKQSIRVLSVQNGEQVFEVSAGEHFLLVLPNPGSGGYVFQNPLEFDPQILILLETEKKYSSESYRSGDFGALYWLFQARKKGGSGLIVRASRPWEKGTPIVIFEASIRVN